MSYRRFAILDKCYYMTTETQKLCPTCATAFPATTDYFYRRTSGGLEYQCKKCAGKRKQKYDKTSALRARAKIDRALLWYNSYKAARSCACCGISDPRVLDFHHTNPDVKNITPSRMPWRGWNVQRMTAELSQCQALCANCHRMEHYEIAKVSPLSCETLGDKAHKTLRTRKRRIAFIEDYKKTKCCIICHNTDYRVLDFHHRDPNTKLSNVAHLAKRGFGIPRIKVELSKCDPICANCHRIYHFKRIKDNSVPRQEKSHAIGIFH
jgi:hypothetical protein